MKEVLHEVEEKMDELEFISILKWSSIKAFVTMLILVFITLVGIPWAIKVIFALFGVAEGAPATLFATILLTAGVFIYVFMKDVKENRVLQAMKWFLIAAVYSIIMYIGGELIFMAILFVGIIITVLFIAGDVGFTGLYTYLDLKTWVDAKKKAKTDYVELAKEEDKKSQNS